MFIRLLSRHAYRMLQHSFWGGSLKFGVLQYDLKDTLITQKQQISKMRKYTLLKRSCTCFPIRIQLLQVKSFKVMSLKSVATQWTSLKYYHFVHLLMKMHQIWSTGLSPAKNLIRKTECFISLLILKMSQVENE